MKKLVVLIAEGFEELEAVTPIDYLRRAGADVTVAGLSGLQLRGSHGLTIHCDAMLRDCDATWDAVVIPGGLPGADNIAADPDCHRLILKAAKNGAYIAAICAAPVRVLAPLGLLKQKRFTCFPGMEREIDAETWSAERVVTDGTLITGQAAGAAGEWALSLVTALYGEAAAEKLAKAVYMPKR